MSWSRDLTNTLDLIDNPSWSNDAEAYIVPKEIDSDASGNIFILSTVKKSDNSIFMGEEIFLGNTLTILSPTGLHIRTIEVADSTDGNGFWSDTENHRVHLATSDDGTSLINTGEKAYLVDFNGNKTTIVDNPLKAEYTSKLGSAVFSNESFFLHNGSDILRFNKSGVLEETIDSGWDGSATSSGDGIELEVHNNIIAINDVVPGHIWTVEKNQSGDWNITPTINVAYRTSVIKIDQSNESLYVTGEGPSRGGDSYLAKYIKGSGGAWEQSWIVSDTESYIIHKLDITSNGEILVADNMSGYTALYDQNGNRLEKYNTNENQNYKASNDFEQTTNGIAFLKNVDNKWITGINSSYPDTASVPIEVDGIAGSISDVTSLTSDGIYKVGDVINLEVSFSETVNVDTTGGTPTLELETGATNRTATYISGSGSSTLLFSYTVQLGDTSSDLDYASSLALSLNKSLILLSCA